jgi:hypothetical protein
MIQHIFFSKTRYLHFSSFLKQLLTIKRQIYPNLSKKEGRRTGSVRLPDREVYNKIIPGSPFLPDTFYEYCFYLTRLPIKGWKNNSRVIFSTVLFIYFAILSKKV